MIWAIRGGGRGDARQRAKAHSGEAPRTQNHTLTAFARLKTAPGMPDLPSPFTMALLSMCAAPPDPDDDSFGVTESLDDIDGIAAAPDSSKRV